MARRCSHAPQSSSTWKSSSWPGDELLHQRRRRQEASFLEHRPCSPAQEAKEAQPRSDTVDICVRNHVHVADGQGSNCFATSSADIPSITVETKGLDTVWGRNRPRSRQDKTGLSRSRHCDSQSLIGLFAASSATDTILAESIAPYGIDRESYFR